MTPPARTTARRSKRGKLRQHIDVVNIDVLDYVLLALMGCLGLVWVRLFFIYAVVNAGCAEQIASFGYIGEGWLKGHSVWSLLYIIAVLASVFCLTIAVTQRRGASFSIKLFRVILLVGFTLLALMFRSLVIDDPRPPDGVVYLIVTENDLYFYPIKSRHSVYRDNFDEDVLLMEGACIFLDRNMIVTAKRSMRDTSKIGVLFGSLFGKKGALIATHQSAQYYFEIGDNDISKILEAMPMQPPLEQWQHHPPNVPF